jgi:hypothetical protein
MTLFAWQLSGGNSFSLPTAPTAITVGSAAGNPIGPPEFPAATMHATPFCRACCSFWPTSSEISSHPTLMLTTSSSRSIH